MEDTNKETRDKQLNSTVNTKPEQDVVSEAEAYYNKAQEKSLSPSQQIEYLTKAIELDGNNPKYYFHRAATYSTINEYYKALEDYTLLGETKSDQEAKGNSYFLRAHLFEKKLKDSQNAVIELTKAIELKPLDPSNYAYRGEIYSEGINDNVKALEDYAKAIEFDPEIREYFDNINNSDLEQWTYMRMSYDDVVTPYIDFFILHADLLPEISDESALIITQNVIESGSCRPGEDEAVPFLKYRIELLIRKNYLVEANKVADTALDENFKEMDIRYWINKKNTISKLINKIEIKNAKIEEKDRIMANLSHTIKNLLGTIIDPLVNMKEDKEFEEVTINNALKGANIIRGIVNAMSLSHKGSLEDFIYDAKNASYNNSMTVHQMFVEALKQGVSSMFDGKYFGPFTRNYFPEKSVFLNAKSRWSEISDSSDINKITSFMNEYMIKTDIELGNAKDLVLGDEKGSSIKMLILIQEIVFNAVKYSSLIPKDERVIRIKFSASEEKVLLNVKNKYNTDARVKTSGLGLEIINNFAKLLDCKPMIERENGEYSIEMKFQNIWRG